MHSGFFRSCFSSCPGLHLSQWLRVHVSRYINIFISFLMRLIISCRCWKFQDSDPKPAFYNLGNLGKCPAFKLLGMRFFFLFFFYYYNTTSSFMTVYSNRSFYRQIYHTSIPVKLCWFQHRAVCLSHLPSLNCPWNFFFSCALSLRSLFLNSQTYPEFQFHSFMWDDEKRYL